MTAQTIIAFVIAALSALAALLNYLGKGKLAAEASTAKAALDDHKEQLNDLIGTTTCIVKGLEASSGKLDETTIKTIIAQAEQHAPQLLGSEDLIKSVVNAISTGHGDVKSILAQNSA